MKTELEEYKSKLEEQIKEMMIVQNDNITDSYMQGLYNGMAFVLSMVDNKEPKFIEADRWKNKKNE